MITFDRHILSPAFTPNLTYKDSDLLNVMLVGRAPLAAACPPDRPYKTFADVMSDAKQRPGKPSIGLLSASGALLLAVYLPEVERLRAQPDLLQGRRADGAGPAGRRDRHV